MRIIAETFKFALTNEKYQFLKIARETHASIRRSLFFARLYGAV